MLKKSKADYWEEFVSGNHALFEDIFKEFYDGLFGYGIKLCSNPEHVKDCIQNIFVTLWERRDQLDHIYSPNVYLYVSLRRNIQKVQIQNKRETSLSDSFGVEIQVTFHADDFIVGKEVEQEKKEKLLNALNKLTNQQKEVLYLHYYNGMSYGEIEKILSINRQSVRNHMYRAIQTLRAVLDVKMMSLAFALFV